MRHLLGAATGEMPSLRYVRVLWRHLIDIVNSAKSSLNIGESTTVIVILLAAETGGSEDGDVTGSEGRDQAG